jgi:hypothetical protein
MIDEVARGAHIFISYSHADAQLAHTLADELRSRGADIWIDTEELRLGDSLIERIAEAINQGDFLAALVSPASVESEWCKRELALAITQGINNRRVTVLPLQVEEVEMPPMLRDRLWAPLREHNVAEVADRITQDVRRHREDTAASSGEATTGAVTESSWRNLDPMVLRGRIYPYTYSPIIRSDEQALVSRVALAARVPVDPEPIFRSREQQEFEDAVATSTLESLVLDLTSPLRRTTWEHFWRRVDPTKSWIVTLGRPPATLIVDGWTAEARAAISLRHSPSVVPLDWLILNLDVAIRPRHAVLSAEQHVPLSLDDVFALLYVPMAALLEGVAPRILPGITGMRDYELLAVGLLLIPNGDELSRYVRLDFNAGGRAQDACDASGIEWYARSLDEVDAPDARAATIRRRVDALFSDGGYWDYEDSVERLEVPRLPPAPAT